MSAGRMQKRNIRFSQRLRAILRGYSLRFNKVASRNRKEGYANIVLDRAGVVEGILYEIPDSELSKLDKYEGHPDHYDRATVTVELDDGQQVDATTYVAQPDKVRDGLKPSTEYLDHLLAARDMVSESYYRELASWKTLD